MRDLEILSRTYAKNRRFFWPKNFYIRVPHTKFGTLVALIGTHNIVQAHRFCSCFSTLFGGLNVKIAIFGHSAGPHPSPNYLQDPKPTFLALTFRDASNGISHNRLSRGIRVAKIRGAKHSVYASEKQFA